MARKQVEILIKARDLVTGTLGRITSGLQRMAQNVSQSFRNTANAVFSLRGAIVSLGLFKVGQSFVDAGSQVEQFRLQLTALTGDARKANAVLTSMREFAAQSPLMTEDVIQAFIRLRAVGVENAEKTVESLGKVALIFNRQVSDVALGFISFEREVLRRLGVEMERTTNQAVLKAGEGAKRITIVTENSAEAIRKALIEIWEKQFPNALELAKETFKGAMSAFQGALFELRADITEVFLPSLTKFILRITQFIQENHTKIVAFFIIIRDNWTTIIDFLKRKAQEFFGKDLFDNRLITQAFDALMGALLDMFIALFEGMISVVGAAASQMWKPVLKAFIAIAHAVERQFAKSIDWMTKGAFRLTEKLAKMHAAEWAKANENLSIDFSQAMLDMEDASRRALEKMQQRLDGLIAASKDFSNAIELSPVLVEIKQRIEETAIALQAAKNEAKAFNDELNKAGPKTQESLSGAQQFFKSFKQQIEDSRTELADWSSAGKAAAKNLADTLTNSFDKAFNDIVDGTFKAKEAFADFGREVIRVILRIAAEKAAAAVIGAVGNALGSFAGFAGFGGGSAPVTPNATGGVRAGSYTPIRRFGTGGVTNGPTLFAAAGEAIGRRREAFVPLPDGNRIPVAFEGGGQQGGTSIQVVQVIQAWDTQDIMRNKDTLIAAVAEGIRKNAGIRKVIQDYA